MSDESDIPPDGGGDEGGGSDNVRDVLADFAAEDEDKPAAKEPEPKEDKPEPKREAKPDKKPEPKAEAKPKEEKEPPKPKPRHRVKVDGEELEVDEDELLRGYQRASSVTKRAQALAQEKKQVEQARTLAKSDPAAALKLLGLDPEEYAKHAEKLVFEKYQREFGPDGQPLSPEQKELAGLRSELESKQAAEKEAADKAKRAEEAQAHEAAQKHWVKTIVSRIEARQEDKGLLPRIAQKLSEAIEADQGVDPADLIDDAIDAAKEDLTREHGQAFGAMPYEQIKARFPDLVEKIRRGVVADFKMSRAQAKPQEVEPAEDAPRRERSPVGPRSSRDALHSFVHG